MTSSPHDALFKSAFELPEHAGALLRSILPTTLTSATDWSSLTLEPGSFVDSQLASRHTDLLFRAKLPDFGTQIEFYLLLEHRSTLDRDLPRRMLAYAMARWDRHRSDNRKHPRPLPIVFPILICHAPGGWTTPTTVQALFAPSPEAIPGLAEFVPHMRVLVEDLTLRNDDALRSLSLQAFPLLTLWLLRNARTPDQILSNLIYWRDAWAAVSLAPNGAEAFMQLLSYIGWICSEEQGAQFRETICMLLPEAKDTVMKYAEKLIQEGRLEGRQEGRQEGRLELLVKQLTLKFGELTSEYQAHLEHATLAQLDRYAERVLSAETLAAVFAD